METDAIEVDKPWKNRMKRKKKAAEQEEEEEEEDESYFSDRNRWRRGGIVDPDANDW